MNVTHGGNLFETSRACGWDWHEVADFSASINPLGPPHGVRPAICAAFDRIEHYPDRDAGELRRALASLWRLDPRQVLAGNGATELLHWFARTVPHETVTLAVPLFSEFHRAYPGARLVPATTPAAWPREGLLVLTQPNNPLGAALCPEELEHWLRSTTHPVAIDESFLEFTGLPSCARLLELRPHLYILRSLTKFYALPGLRVGALLAAAADIDAWQSHREPWQVNALAEAAAVAAIADPDFAARTLTFVAAERAWLLDRLSALPGVHPAPSAANYLFVRLDYPADPLARHLANRRILIRDCTGTPGIAGDAVRLAIRTRAENERLLDAWKEFRCAS